MPVAAMSADIELRIPHGTSYTVRYVETRSEATPTEKQYATLRILGSGNALICGTRRETEPLIRRGWVTFRTFDTHGYKWVRITPDGLRALAIAVERYGLPVLEHVEAVAA